MDKITENLFDLKRQLEDTKEVFYDPSFDYTDIQRKQGDYELEKAILSIDKVLSFFVDISDAGLKCEKRQTRGNTQRCDYCNAYSNEKCRI